MPESMKKPTFIIALLATLAVLYWIYCEVQFRRHCYGYLDRAANANSIELAQKQLKKALSFIRDNDLTGGYANMLWTTPSGDIEFWYDNLKSCEEELSRVSPDASALERSNLLLKLRESLLDEDGKVIRPIWLSIYPYQRLALIHLIVIIVVWLYWVITFEDRPRPRKMMYVGSPP